MFPFLSILTARYLVTHLPMQSYRQRIKPFWWGVMAVLMILAGIQIGSFFKEAQEGIIFVLAALALLIGLNVMVYRLFFLKYHAFIQKPQTFLWPFLIGYMLFFAVMAQQSTEVYFLKKVHVKLTRILESNSW